MIYELWTYSLGLCPLIWVGKKLFSIRNRAQLMNVSLFLFSLDSVQILTHMSGDQRFFSWIICDCGGCSTSNWSMLAFWWDCLSDSGEFCKLLKSIELMVLRRKRWHSEWKPSVSNFFPIKFIKIFVSYQFGLRESEIDRIKCRLEGHSDFSRKWWKWP